MKKITLILIAVISLAIAPASYAQFRWGAYAGYTNNNMTFKQDLVSVDAVSAYSAGVIGELMFPGIGFGMNIGLGYNQQGANVNLGQREVWSSLGYGKERLYIHSLEIPVHLRFKYTRLNGLEDIVAPIVFGGPSFNIQVAHGKCDAFKYSGGDLGLTVGGGAELYKRLQITGGYTWGMTYVVKTKLLDDFSARPRQWFVRATYMF